MPWSTLRATHFYDFILAGAQTLARLPVVPVPAGVNVQPIDADEVAARLVQLVFEAPSGRVPDLGGPEVRSFADLLRAYLRAKHRRRLMIPIRVPGTSVLRAGGMVVAGQEAAPAPTAGRLTWEGFLAGRVASGPG